MAALDQISWIGAGPRKHQKELASLIPDDQEGFCSESRREGVTSQGASSLGPCVAYEGNTILAIHSNDNTERASYLSLKELMPKASLIDFIRIVEIKP